MSLLVMRSVAPEQPRSAPATGPGTRSPGGAALADTGETTEADQGMPGGASTRC